jgi:hypothetical protein
MIFTKENSVFAGGIGYATSRDGINWIKWVRNPIMVKTEMLKTFKRCYCPWVIRDGVGLKMYYSCKSQAGVYATAVALLNGGV